MLQMAANSAHSWLWTNHLKSKQGKWLRLSLGDMEEKVKSILIVIEEDADSFGKRAEMYYKNRPELINFVEESYRAYRALADRYEHISGELQNANNTIANLFPDQVQLGMEDNDDENLPKPSKYNCAKIPKPPENPKFKIPPIKDMKRSLPPKTNNSQAKKTTPQMSKDEAHGKMDKLQKEILVLQTEKEFVKSSYENGLAKYWDIEKRIEETLEKLFSLQDDSGVDMVIEDNNALALRTTSALKSCGGTLLQLQEQQERTEKEARVESERVKDAKEKLKALKERYLQHHTDNQETPDEPRTTRSSSKNLEEEAFSLKQEGLELASICEKVSEYFEKISTSSHTVVELAEMVDELVKKVVSLESAVSSQTALIERLRSETDELQKHLQVLDEDKMSITDGSQNLSNKVKELEEELHGIQDLNQSVEEQSRKLQTDFTETCCNLSNLSQKLQTLENKDEIKKMGVPLVEQGISLNAEPYKKCQEQEDMRMSDDDSVTLKDGAVEGKVQSIQDLDLHENTDQENHAQPDITLLSKSLQDPQQDKAEDRNSNNAEDSVANVELQEQSEEQNGRENWKNLFLNGLEEREKILLSEYTVILQNYRETKRELSEIEKKNQESLYEVMAHIQELQSDNTAKDMEIQSLKRKLSIVQTAPDDNMNGDLKKSEDSHNTRTGNTKDQWKYLFNEFHKKSAREVMPRLLEDLLKERNIDFATKSKELSGITSMENPTEDDIKLVLNEEPYTLSTVEEEFRRDIDGQLEENLEFWLRFSTASHQVQKFQTKLRDLQEEFSKQNKDNKKQEVGANAADPAVKSNVSATKNKLRELHGELSVWLEQNVLLKNELQHRFSSLCKIQEEISRISKAHSETEQEKFTSQLAARYQGEVMNMKQENNRVAEELEAGLNLVRRLQLEVEKTLSKSNENSSRSGSKSHRRHHHQQQVKHPTSRTKVPLRNFLFGSKTKKASLFSCASTPIQEQYDMKKAGGGLPM